MSKEHDEYLAKLDSMPSLRAINDREELTIDFGPPFGKVAITQELVRKSLDYNSALDYRLRNPEKLLMDNAKTVRLYDEMMLDDAINSTLNIKKRMVLSVPGEFRAASKSPQNIEINDFVRKVFNSLPVRWLDILDNLLDANIYGFKIAEKVWDIVGGKVLLRNLKFRHSLLYDFEYDEMANLSVLHIGYYWGGQHTAIKGEDIAKKFLIFVYPYLRDGIYYGQSELREIFNLWLAKQNILKWRNAYIQRFGMPVVEVVYDVGTATPDEISRVEDLIQHLQESSYVMNPGFWDEKNKEIRAKFKFNIIDVSKKDGSTTDIFERAIDQIDRMIKRKLMLPDEMGFSEGVKGGSLAKAEVQFDLLTKVVIQFYHGRLEDCVNKELIPQLVDYNFPNVEDYPAWQFDKIDNKLKGDLLQILIQNGVIAASEPWIRKYVNIPDAPETNSAKDNKRLSIIESQSIADGSNVDTVTTPITQGKDTVSKFPNPDRTSFPQQQNAIKNIGPESQPPVNIGSYGGQEGLPLQRIPGPTPAGLSKTSDGIDPSRTPMYRTFKRQSIHDVYNFDSHRKDLDKNEADFVKEYNDVTREMGENLVRQIQRKKIIENKDLKEFNKIVIPKGDLKSLVTQYLSKMYLLGKANAIEQNRGRLKKARPQAFTRKYFFTIDETDDGIDWLDRTWIDNYLKEYGELGTLTQADKEYLKQVRDKAFFVTGETEANMLSVFKILDSGLKDGLMARDLIAKIETQLSDDRKKYALTIARTNGNEAYNTASMNLYMSDDVRPAIEAFLFEAIMDDQTTEICAGLNGQVIYKDDPELAQYNPPLHFNAILEGTDIITESGDKTIENIIPGDMVLTHKGRYKKVMTSMAKNYSESIRRIELSSGKVIFVTKEHPCLTTDGWKASDTLNIGDKLFEYNPNIIEPVEDLIRNPYDFEPMFDEKGVPYQIMGGSLTGTVIFSIDFNNDTFILKDKISNVFSNLKLDIIPPEEAYRIKKTLENDFVSCGILPHVIGEGSGHLDPGFRIVARVVGEHPFGMGGKNGVIFLAETESPMVAASLMKRWISIGNPNLIDSTSDFYSMSLAPGGQDGLAASNISLDRADGKILSEMVGVDKSLDGVEIREIHNRPPVKWDTPTIITIVDEEVKNKTVFNIAVEDDQTYHANGIIVHNCRSTLIPIFIGENNNPDSYFSGYQDKMPELDHGIRPAAGFGA